MTTFEDTVASCVLTSFAALPAKRKPRRHNDGRTEWVPLSGIVLAKGNLLTPRCTYDRLETHDSSAENAPFTCVALGTGMKCLPAAKVPSAKGNILHDWHSEIVAIRAFNAFLLEECARLLRPPWTSSFVRVRKRVETGAESIQPFAIRQDVKIHMYSSEAPCGDASMELTMIAQEDATPWIVPPTSSAPLSNPATDQPSDVANQLQPLRGRSYFSELGAVRLKPSRLDAPATLSKSCSDKIARKQCTSLLSSLTSLLILPSTAYLTSLILPRSQLHVAGMERAFGSAGRMAALKERRWKGDYAFRPFVVRDTAVEFEYSRRSACHKHAGHVLTSSNLTAVKTPFFEETLIGGVLQGRRQDDPRGASRISRRRMWSGAKEVVKSLSVVSQAKQKEDSDVDAHHRHSQSEMEPDLAMEMCERICEALCANSYDTLKALPLLEDRRRVKTDVGEVLKGWVKNESDDFALDSR